MSYIAHFNLTEPPFRLTPDPDFVYWSKQHARAKAYMESTIWLADGFVVISGEIGSGKTTLLQSFLADIGDDIVYAVVSQTQLTVTQFLQAVLTEFGFKPLITDRLFHAPRWSSGFNATKFPVFFLLIRELRSETGSIRTACTATQLAKNEVLRRKPPSQLKQIPERNPR